MWWGRDPNLGGLKRARDGAVGLGSRMKVFDWRVERAPTGFCTQTPKCFDK